MQKFVDVDSTDFRFHLWFLFMQSFLFSQSFNIYMMHTTKISFFYKVIYAFHLMKTPTKVKLNKRLINGYNMLEV